MGKQRNTILILGEGPTELFFLYYFRYTSKMYVEQDSLLRDLNQCCDYRKKIDFFIKCRGLHSYFEKKGGSLSVAIDNSNRSILETRYMARLFKSSTLRTLWRLAMSFQMMESKSVDR